MLDTCRLTFEFRVSASSPKIMTDSLLLEILRVKTGSSKSLSQNKEQKNLSSPVVLIIENHDDTRSLLKILVEGRGYSVAEATDGEQVLELFGDGELDLVLPDLILTETVLPGLDGLAFIKKFRTFKALAKVPVVFLSSRAEPALKSKALDLGGNDFLIKPIELNFLEQTLDKYLDKNQIKLKHYADGGSRFNGGVC